MAAPTLTYDDLIKLKPCSDRLSVAIERIGTAQEWNGNGVTAQQARDAGMHFSDIVWAASAASRNDADVARRLRLWAADCAARVLHVYERSETSCAPRNAIVASRAYSRGEIDEAARAAARDAAWAAARDAAWAAAWDAARAAARAAAWAAAKGPPQGTPHGPPHGPPQGPPQNGPPHGTPHGPPKNNGSLIGLFCGFLTTSQMIGHCQKCPRRRPRDETIYQGLLRTLCGRGICCNHLDYWVKVED
jgi:hypothetical protein